VPTTQLSAVTGTWVLIAADNMDNFFDATNASDEFMKMYDIRNASEKIAQNPNYLVKCVTVDTIEGTFQFTMALDGKLVHDTGLIKMGKETDLVVPDGRTVKVYVESDSAQSVKITKTSENFKSVAYITADKDLMTKMMICNGVTGTETFRRL